MVERAQLYARIGGWLYLLIFIMAGVSMGLQSNLVVPGDAAATAARIAAAQTQWHLALAATLIMFTTDIPLAVIFFVLLRPVSASLSLLSALLRFAEAVIGSINLVWYVAPVLLVGGAAYLQGVEPHTLDGLAYLSLKLYDYGFGIALIPFGLHCVVLGYLIYRSKYLPKTLGVLLVIAGSAYVINSLALLAAPTLTGVTFYLMFATALPAELGLCIWLIVKGVDAPKWALAAGTT